MPLRIPTHLFFAALCILCGGNARADSPEPISTIHVNSPRVELVTTVLYDDAGTLAEGMIPVKKGVRWGYLDTTGREVIEFKYRYARRFSEGLAAVQDTLGKWGYVDRQGHEVIAPQFSFAQAFHCGVAKVGGGNGRGALINRQGRPITPFKYGSAHSTEHNGWTLVEDGRTGKWGFVDTAGREVIPCMYDQTAGLSSDGTEIAVKLGDKWGHIDTANRITTPLIYDCTWLFWNGLAPVCKDGKWGYMDQKTRRLVIPCRYTSASHALYGAGVVRNGHKQWGMVRPRRRTVLPFVYDDIGYSFRCGMIVVKKDGYAGVLDRDFNEIVSLQRGYEDVRITYTGLIWARQMGQWGLFDTQGNSLMPPQFSNVIIESGKYSLAKIDGKWVLIAAE